MSDKEKGFTPLGPGQVRPLGYGNNNLHDVTVPAGTRVEDILRPEFWAHNAGKLRQFDDIVVREASGAFRHTLYVTSCSRTSATVELLPGGYTRDTGSIEHKGHLIEFGGERGWRVVRKTDKQTLHDSEQTRDAALDWLKTHLGEGVKKAA